MTNFYVKALCPISTDVDEFAFNFYFKSFPCGGSQLGYRNMASIIMY